jgi:mono/diheme cytochrome c family protein
MRRTTLLLYASAMAVLGCSSATAAEPDEMVSFSRQIAPILIEKCVACHGPKQPKSNYRLDTFEAMLRPGEFELPPVTPGKLDESELYRLVAEETSKDSWMPKGGERLGDEQIALIRRWIEQGARFDGADRAAPLASLVPRTYDPAPQAYRAPLPITAVAFHPQGHELAVSGYHEITIWNAADGSLLRRVGRVPQRIYGLAYSPDGAYLAVAAGVPGTRGEVLLVDPAGGDSASEHKLLASMPDVAFDVAFSPDGKRLAACAADRSIRVFALPEGTQELLIEDHADWVMAVAWNPDGTRLASASLDKTSKVFDAQTGEGLQTYNGHNERVFGVAFSPDGKQVITSGGDRQLHFWNPDDGKKIANVGGFGHEVYQLELLGGDLLSCSADKTVRQHRVDNRTPVRVYSGHADWVYAVAVHAPSKRVASGSYDGEVRVWNAEDGKELLKFLAAPGLARGP